MGFDLDNLTRKLSTELGEQRLLHTLGTVQTAVVLADLHGVDRSRAAVAALLHDCAKALSSEELLALADRHGVCINDPDRSFPGIWHAPVGALLARQRYGIEDEAILEAIAHHPLGKSNPSALLLVVMAADYSEPTRDFEGLEELRGLVRRQLVAGVEAMLHRKVGYLRARGKPVHPRVYETLASLGAKPLRKE